MKFIVACIAGALAAFLLSTAGQPFWIALAGAGAAGILAGGVLEALDQL